MKCIIGEGSVRTEAGRLRIRDFETGENQEIESVLIWSLLGEDMELRGIDERDVIQQCMCEAAYGDIRYIGIAIFGGGFSSASQGANYGKQLKRRDPHVSPGMFNHIFRRIRNRMVLNLSKSYTDNEQKVRRQAIRALATCRTIQDVRDTAVAYREECDKMVGGFMNDHFDALFGEELQKAIRCRTGK